MGLCLLQVWAAQLDVLLLAVTWVATAALLAVHQMQTPSASIMTVTNTYGKRYIFTASTDIGLQEKGKGTAKLLLLQLAYKC